MVRTSITILNRSLIAVSSDMAPVDSRSYQPLLVVSEIDRPSYKGETHALSKPSGLGPARRADCPHHLLIRKVSMNSTRSNLGAAVCRYTVELSELSLKSDDVGPLHRTCSRSVRTGDVPRRKRNARENKWQKAGSKRLRSWYRNLKWLDTLYDPRVWEDLSNFSDCPHCGHVCQQCGGCFRCTCPPLVCFQEFFDANVAF